MNGKIFEIVCVPDLCAKSLHQRRKKSLAVGPGLLYLPVTWVLWAAHATSGASCQQPCVGTTAACLCPSQFSFKVFTSTQVFKVSISTQVDPTAEFPLWRKQCHAVPFLSSPLTKFSFQERLGFVFKCNIHPKRTCVLKQAIEPFITSLGDSSHEFFIFCRAHSRSATALCGCTWKKATNWNSDVMRWSLVFTTAAFCFSPCTLSAPKQCYHCFSF